MLSVFLKAGFQAQEGGIGEAIGLVRKSSSIQDDDKIAEASQKNDEANLVSLMKSPEGQEIVLDTDFKILFDKVLSIMAASLAKSRQIFEDKIIIQNCLEIIVGITLYQKSIFERFVNFQSEGQIKGTEDLILEGLLCSEEKVRVDFMQSLGIIAVNVNEPELNALYFTLGIMAKNFASISNKPSRQFFELFNRLIDLKAMRDEYLGDAADDSKDIYDPEDLLN